MCLPERKRESLFIRVGGFLFLFVDGGRPRETERAKGTSDGKSRREPPAK